MFTTVSIDLPEEILLDLNESKNDFEDYMKKFIAVDLYTNKHISLGYSAAVADMPKEEFIKLLSLNNISIFDFEGQEDFEEEMNNA